MVKHHSDSGNPLLPLHGLLFLVSRKGSFFIYHSTDRMAHTMAFVTSVMEHWLEQEIAHVSTMKDWSDQKMAASRELALYLWFSFLTLGDSRGPETRSGPGTPEPSADFVQVLGSVGCVVQVPAPGPHPRVLRRENRHLLRLARWVHLCGVVVLGLLVLGVFGFLGSCCFFCFFVCFFWGGGL